MKASALRPPALVEDLVDAEPAGDLTLQGLARPMATFSRRGLR